MRGSHTLRAALAEGFSLYSETRAFNSAICLYKPALQTHAMSANHP